MTPKTLVSIRISEATRRKLLALAAVHGTQTEAIAVAIELLFRITTIDAELGRASGFGPPNRKDQR